MVSKPTTPSVMALTPTKDLKSSPTLPLLHHHHHLHLPGHNRKRRSPLKTITSSAVAASIGRPFRSCRRRLAKLFANLATGLRRASAYAAASTASTTPSSKPKLARRPGFRRRLLLSYVAPATAALPPLSDPNRRTVFLDLDETLVHSSIDQPAPPAADGAEDGDVGPNYDFVVRPVIEGRVMTFYVRKRPGVDEFLAALRVSARYEVVIFTAGLREYASLVLDRLDPDRTLFEHRLYRDACREAEGGRLTKDLSVVGRDLARSVLVDDNPNSYVFQPENAIPVSSFLDDPKDRELQRLRRFFDEVLPRYDDAREAARLFRSQAVDIMGDGGWGEKTKKMDSMISVMTKEEEVVVEEEEEEEGDRHDELHNLDITFTSSQKSLKLQGQLMWGLPS